MSAPRWVPGSAPVAVVMIARDEARHLEAALSDLSGWADEVFLVDSLSRDATVDIALRHGVHVVQRPFRGFGEQWNFALRALPITAPWTMKLDPDERLTPELKRTIELATTAATADGLSVKRRLWFMGSPLPVTQRLLRVWRTGRCRFSDVAVNEHPLVDGRIEAVAGELEHHDSPDLHHWLDKQNRYSTLEAASRFAGEALAAEPKLFGAALERRMWLKRWFWHLPFRFVLLHLWHLFGMGAWRAGKAGFDWARLRTELFRLQELKLDEMRRQGRAYAPPPPPPGPRDPRVPQHD